MPKLNYGCGLCSALIVGLGQIIKGDGKKGLVLLLTYYFALPAAVYASLTVNGHVFLAVFGGAVLAGLGLWFYSIIDALKIS